MKTSTRKPLSWLGLSLLAAGLSPHLAAAQLKFSLAASVDNFELGSGIAAAGDLNADGVTDIAVADRSARVGTCFASGCVEIVSGADGSLLRSYTGSPAASQSFGSALVTLNADGDAIPDLAVGAPGQSGSAGYGAGALRIYSGANGALLRYVLGPNGSQMGVALANAGDQDGDGLDDLYVGAPNANGSRGAVYVVSSSSGLTLRSITTEFSTSAFGVSLAALGDVDGDGLNDVAVGAPGFRGAFYQAGRILLVRSSGDATAPAITGDSYYNRLGESLAGVADANGDGLPDLLVGSYSGGSARLVSGADLSTLVDLSIPTLPSYQPLMVGGSLDFDGDGTADWLIGSPGLGQANNQAVGGIRVISGTDQATLFESTASAPYTGLGGVVQVLPGMGFAAGEPYLCDPISHGYGMVHVWEVSADADGDGVLDAVDAIPHSIMDATVIVLGVDSAVPNRVNEQGITLADRFAELDALSDYKVAALYYAEAQQLSKALAKARLLSKEEERQISTAARQGALHTPDQAAKVK